MIEADATTTCVTHVGQPYAPNCGGVFDETTFSASVVRQAATDWIASATQPFFAYVCFNPPHHQWQVPPHTLLSSPPNLIDYPPGESQNNDVDNRNAYLWMVEAIDEEIGKLIDNIPAGKLAKTTIIIVSDNGTPSQVIDGAFQPSHAKGTIYEQGINVPMIAHGYKVHSGSAAICDELVNTVDIWRTVLALAGVPPPPITPTYTYDGKSFKHLLADPGLVGNRTTAFSCLYRPNGEYNPALYPEECGVACEALPPDLASEIPFYQRAITDGRYKYIRRYSPVPGGGTYQEAYDLETDPLETVDLRAQWEQAFGSGWSQCADSCDEQVIDSPPGPPPSPQRRVWDLRTALIGLSGS